MTTFPPHAPQYGAIDTYRIAAEWLDGHGTVYDWGCGQQFAKQFFRQSGYVGLDGTFGNERVALEDVRIQCDSILMRHILENNPWTWRQILRNALSSFSRRMALVTFMPFAEREYLAKVEHYETGDLGYVCLCKRELIDMMGDLLVSDRPVQTTHSEHVFFLEWR